MLFLSVRIPVKDIFGPRGCCWEILIMCQKLIAFRKF